MPVCIYCREDKPIEGFNREHVLHAAFGGFQDALTLVAPHDPPVCKGCNTHFSRTIDLVLTRDSIEAVLRLEAGLKSVTELRDLFHGRVSFRLPATNPRGPLHLVPVPTPAGEGYGVAPAPQVCFARRSGGFKVYTEAQLQAENPSADPDVDTSRMTLYWSGIDEAARDRLTQLLAIHGITFHAHGPVEFPSESNGVDAETHFHLDKSVARAVAKIAFNYMAKVTSQLDPTFAYRADFDPIRAFIRFGTGRPGAFFQVREQPREIEAEDLATKGHHVLALQWNRGRDTDVLGYVQLFDHYGYVIRLAKGAQGTWIDVRRLHVYDLETRRVYALRRSV